MIMGKLFWFFNTGISTRQEEQLSFDLTFLLPMLIQGKIWEKSKYRTHYLDDFEEKDIQKINKLIIHIHTSEAPLSNFHDYLPILKAYCDTLRVEKHILFSSGLSQCENLAVVELDCNFENEIIENISIEDEMDPDKAFCYYCADNYRLGKIEENKLKSFVFELLQLFVINMHFNFPTSNYRFSFSQFPIQSGLLIKTDNRIINCKASYCDVLNHYILYEKEKDRLFDIMNKTLSLWCKDNISFYYFIDTLKGNHVDAVAFTKLVFTIESFFEKNTSSSFMRHAITLMLADNEDARATINKKLRDSFEFRNEIAHGGSLPTIANNSSYKGWNTSELFIDLKIIIIKLFAFLIQSSFYNEYPRRKIDSKYLFSISKQKS